MQLKSLYPNGACKGTTKEGKKCGIRDIFQNGFCRHHGGQGKLIREIRAGEKMRLKIDRTLRRARRIDRMTKRLMKENPRLREIVDRINARRSGEALPPLPTLPKVTDGGQSS